MTPTTCPDCQAPYAFNDRVKAELPTCRCATQKYEAAALAERQAKWADDAMRRVEALQLGVLDSHDLGAPAVEGWEDPKGPILGGENLVMMGPVGTTKTTVLKRVAYHAALAGLKVRGGSTVRLLSELKDPERIKPLMAWLEGGHLLVLDDLDKVMGTQYEVERLFLLVDLYWSFKRSIAVTMNTTPAELQKKLANRKGLNQDKEVEAVISRLMANATVVVLDGPDLRQATR